jgi:hypothetical protein
MPSTYTTNLGIEKIATGEQSGTWGSTTNTNLDLLDQAVNGVEQVTLAAAGSSGSPNDLPITDGAASDGRNKFIEFIDSGDLGGTAYVQLTPNDAEKIVFLRNSLSASRSVIVFQGTYNASNDFEIPNGKDVVLKFDGAGASATVTQMFVDLKIDALDATTVASTNVNATTVDSTNVEVTNIKAKDGTASASIADSTGVMTIASAVLTTADINGGTADNVTIGGGTAAAGTFTTATATTGNITTVNATTVDTTNIEVTNVKAKDGTASATIADSTGVMTIASSVLTTTDINGGTIDGVTIGGASAGAGTFTTITGSGDMAIDTDTLFVDVSEDRVGINNSSPATALDVTGTVTADGLAVSAASTPTFKVTNTTAGSTGSPQYTELLFEGYNNEDRATIKVADTANSGNLGFLEIHTQNTSNVVTRRLNINSGGDISFYEDTGTTPKLFWDASAESLSIGSTASTTDRVFQVTGTATSSATTQFGIVVNPTFPTAVTGALYNLYIGPNLTSGTTLTNLYNIYLEANNKTGSTVTNSYGLYQAGSGDKNYFAGNVGIGTTTPTNTSGLEIQTGGTTAGLWVQTGGTTSSYTIADFRTGTNLSALSVFGNGNSIFEGNVGIGTTSPDASMGPGLHIKSASGNSLILEKDTGAAMQFRSDASTIRATIAGINGADGLTIATGAAQTERMRIDSSGNLLVGTTSANGSTSNTKPVVAGAFRSLNGTLTSLASGTAYTMFTASADFATWMVNVHCIVSNAIYSETAIVQINNSSVRVDIISAGSGVAISNSGLDIKVTQTSGTTQAELLWSAVRMA